MAAGLSLVKAGGGETGKKGMLSMRLRAPIAASATTSAIAMLRL